MAGSMMGWQYENSSYCRRQMPSLHLVTDEINLSKVQCQGILPSYQSDSQAWQHCIRIHNQFYNLNLVDTSMKYP